jgi:cbb3-type cytochrome oxidase cytochrome c subunit
MRGTFDVDSGAATSSVREIIGGLSRKVCLLIISLTLLVATSLSTLIVPVIYKNRNLNKI